VRNVNPSIALDWCRISAILRPKRGAAARAGQSAVKGG